MLAQALVLALTSSFLPQSVRISPELPRSALGDVEDFQLDGVGGVLFKGDCTRDGQLELYRARVDGTLLQTALGLPNPSGIESYRLTPDGQRVLFTNALGLHSAPLDGSLAPVLLVAGAVLNYTVTPDSLVVLYGRDLHDLFSVPVTGGASTLLEQAAVPSFVGGDFKGSADSTRVLHRVKVGDGFELRSRPVSGGPFLLHADTGTVVDFKLSSSGTELLFRATTIGVRTGLYRVPYAGGTPVELSPPLALGAQVPADYAFVPGQTHALFRATTGVITDPASSSELWIAPLDGSTPAVKLSAPLAPGADVLDFRFDGTRVLYRATGASGIVELFSVPLDLSAPPVSLSAPMLAGMTVDDYLLTADGARAVFASNRLDAGRRRLWSVAVGGGTPQELDARTLDATVQLALAPAGRVLYAAEDGSSRGLFLVPTDASAAARRLDGPAVAGSRVTGLAVSGTRAVYVSSEELAETFELRSVPLDVVQPSTRLSRASEVFTFGGAIGAFGVSPDGSVAVMMTDGAAPTLYTTSLARPEASERSLPSASNATIGELLFTPDSSAFAFTRVSPVGFTWLFGAPTRTQADPVLLAGPTLGAATIRGLAVHPDSTRVFYLAPTPAHSAELFSSFLDGREPPVILNGPLISGSVASGRVAHFELAADGLNLIYLADQEQVNRVELYSVSSGGGPAFRLNGALGFGEDVLQARIAPDGQRALFVADDVLDNVENLHVVPLDGSAAPLPLTGHASGAHSVSLLAFTRDGASALYRVRFPGGAAELRSVSIDGSGAPITLDDDAFDPSELVLTADGTRVVYRLVSSGSLRSTRLDGSTAALELDDLGSIDPAGHQLTADSTHVVYRKNQQLWQARVDGSTAPLRLGATLGQIKRHELTRTDRILAGTATQLFVFETLTATPRFLAPLDSTRRFLATPEGRRVLSVNGELYLDYLTRPHLPR